MRIIKFNFLKEVVLKFKIYYRMYEYLINDVIVNDWFIKKGNVIIIFKNKMKYRKSNIFLLYMFV